MDPLAQLDAETATAVLEARPVETALEDGLRGTDAVEVGEELYTAAGDSQALAEAVQRQLLVHREVYPAVRNRAEGVLDRMDNTSAVDDHALLALDWATPEDWGFWAIRLSDGTEATEQQGGWSADAAASIVRQLGTDPSEAENAEQALAKLVPFLALASADKTEKLAAAVSEVLGGRSWWSTEDLRKQHEDLHQAIRRLLDTPGGAVSSKLVPLLGLDLKRPKQATVAARPRTRQRSAAAEKETLIGLRRMGAELPADEAADLYEEWRSLAIPADEAEAHRLTHLLVALAARADAGELKVDQTTLDTDRVTSAITGSYRRRNDVLAQWLCLSPNVPDVAEVLADATASSSGARDAVGSYAERLTDDDRTSLIEAMLDRSADPAWVEVLAQHGVHDDGLAERLASDVEAASTVDERDRLVRLLVALRPGTSKAQRRVANLIIHLLGTGVKADFNVALRAIDALGTHHRSAERLREAFKSAADERGLRVPQRSVEGLARAGVRLPKKSVTDSAWDLAKSLFGGR